MVQLHPKLLDTCRDYKRIEWAFREKSKDKLKLPVGGKFQSFPDVNSFSDWLKSRCPDINSHSRMPSRDV
jgi:hypothetical protein